MQVVCLFPFFWIDRSQMGVTLHRIAATQYQLLGIVAGIISWLPLEARLAVVRKSSGERHAACPHASGGMKASQVHINPRVNIIILTMMLFPSLSGGMNMDLDAEMLTQRLLQYGSVRNNFFLANSEYPVLDETPPWDLLQGLGQRLHVLG